MALDTADLLWEELQNNGFSILNDSHTRTRLPALHKILHLLQSADLANSSHSDTLAQLAAIVVKTYPYYQDKKSRAVVLQVLHAYVAYDRKYLVLFISFVHSAAQKSSNLAPSDILTLLSWANQLAVQAASDGDSALLLRATEATALLICSSADATTFHTEVPPHRRRLYESSVAHTKRALESVLGITRAAQPLVAAVVGGATPASAVLLYLAVLADCVVQLQPSQPAYHAEMTTSGVQEPVLSFFVDSVVLAKTPPATHAVRAFCSSYIAHFFPAGSVAQTVLPAVEKAIMRSSETAFTHITKALFATPGAIDLSAEFASSKLLGHLLSGMKATKETVREKAHTSLCLALDNAVPHLLATDALKIIDDVLKAVKSTSNADSKVFLLNCLTHVPCADSTVAAGIVRAILPLTSKELNEHILAALVEVLAQKYLATLAVSAPAGDQDVVLQFAQGLQNPKLPLRSIWASQLARLLYKQAPTEPITAFVGAIFPSLLRSLAEAQKSPLLAVSNKGISSAYLCILLASFLNDADVDVKAVYTASFADADDTISILTSPRVITKLAGFDQALCLRALVAGFPHASNISSFVSAYLYFLISSNVLYQTRLEALEGLKSLLARGPATLSASFVTAILQITSLLDTPASDGDLRYNLKFLAPVLNTLVQIPENDVAKKSLADLIMVAHHARIPVKEGWIGLVLRASFDPKEIVAEFADYILESLFNILVEAAIESDTYVAACKAIGTADFVNPDVIPAKIEYFLLKDLDKANLEEIDSTKLQIWKAPEGELVVDILNSKPKKAEDKNSRDYETRKWEESLKKELSQKNKVAAKLTKEEQALVKEQLAKESEIRKTVGLVIKKFHRAFYVVKELSGRTEGYLTSTDLQWLAKATIGMLELLKCPLSPQFFGHFGTNTFIGVSNLLTSRLGHLKNSVGVAILRANNVEGIEEKFLLEPVVSLLSRVLFRIKILADDYFDMLSFAYILPLITRILEIGREVAIKNSKKQVVTSEFSDEDPEEEHLSLVIDIISSQSMLQDGILPRDSILKLLIALMGIRSKAKMAKECFLTVCQQISINVVLSDLNLLLGNLVTTDTFVKTAILQGIDSQFDLTEEMSYSNEIWIARYDNDSNVAELAKTIWDDNEFKLLPDTPNHLLKFIDAKDPGMRLTVAKAIVASVEVLQDSDDTIFDVTLNNLITLFYEMEVPPPPELDKFGLAVNKHALEVDQWESRSTIALALKYLSPLCGSQEAVQKIFHFLVDRETLGDKEDLVCQELLEVGVDIIKQHGLDHVEILIPVFEKCLAQADTASKKQDRIRESVIILYGSLGRHLDASDERLTIIVDRLLATLDTPSEDVQYAVSECIAPLVKSFESKLQEHLDALFEKLWNGRNLAVRRGAAYGIAGLVKGAGIKSLFANDVMRNITIAADDKKNEHVREGVSFVLDCLSQSLGEFFEPYVIETLPIILKSLGDPSPLVREATDMAARQIMKSTTSYGVKKLIPLAIRNLDDIAWRSKKGSVELLGSMAYLDPTQLSASLSTIVPEIVGVLNDSHKEVRKAADQSLKRFGEVIRNPEIQAIVPDLIKAIGDPTKYTDDALEKLIKTQFVHYIDGPSLALIIHVIHRGMRDRSASTKKKACQIVGNMAILVDSKDLLPYLSSLIEELEVAMVDPVPATRSTGARALGSLVEKLGEEQFPDLIPRLMSTLNDPSKAGDRLGSAQALAEVICGLGLTKLDEMLPDILAYALAPQAHTRAGFMPLLLFLPVCFGSQFAPYLSKIIPPILAGLADTDEEIRDTSLRAGRLIVKNYASKAVDLLLPELENGLSDSSYRIRLSSVELTGDLLFQVTGISGKNELTEDQVEVNRSLVEVLGQDRRDRILAALFVCRSDVTAVVRAAAIDIWKALVANTPRTVKEIIPSLTHIIIRRLASSDEVHRTIAAATFGEVVRRVGANALSKLLPTLEEALVSSDAEGKQGICIALTELINSASDDALETYQDIFIRIIKEALVDVSGGVREAAAQAFEALQERLGKVVIDEILPNLLHMLDDTHESGNALLALEELMATKSDVIFPILIPTLLTPPIDVFKVKALSSLASVAGSALYSRLASIINTLLQAVITAKESGSSEDVEEVSLAFDKILLSIDDDAGVHPVMQQLMHLVKHQDPKKRAAICERLGAFFASTTLDYSIYVPDMVSQFILSLGDPDADVVQGVFEALSALVKAQDKLMLEKLVKPAHQALSITGVKGEPLAGFALPKGPSCVLPIFSHGLMYGNNEQRELSALSIAEIIDRTPAANLRPFATTITGPLIRVIGERVSSDIKSAILTALTNLLMKIPQFLRPFIPQLQRTFVRSLSDSTNEKLRNGAVTALGVLIEFQPRVDSLVTELVSTAKGTEDQAIKNTMLKAMLQVIVKGGQNMSEASKTMIVGLVEDEISVVTDKTAVAYARLLGSLSQVLSTEEAANILKEKVLSKRSGEDELKFAVLSINSFLKESPMHIFNTGLLEDVVSFVVECCNSSLPYISDNATVAAGKLVLLEGEVKSPKQNGKLEASEPFSIGPELITQLLTQLAKNAVAPASASPDTRRLALVVIRIVSHYKLDVAIKPNLNILVPSVFGCLRDSIIPIRLAAEKAYLALFNLVEDAEMLEFNAWFENASKNEISSVVGTVIQPRSIGDYTKRVGNRLATVERERVQAGGDDETMFSDRYEDENEVWAVGGY